MGTESSYRPYDTLYNSTTISVVFKFEGASEPSGVYGKIHLWAPALGFLIS